MYKENNNFDPAKSNFKEIFYKADKYLRQKRKITLHKKYFKAKRTEKMKIISQCVT